jgi:hypothetical protein
MTPLCEESKIELDFAVEFYISIVQTELYKQAAFYTNWLCVDSHWKKLLQSAFGPVSIAMRDKFQI